VLTYGQLLYEVRRCAAALRGLGIGSGDRVAIYMPTCAEAIVLMLACARVGAPHLVVFAGFGAGALADRVRLAGAKALFCADVTWRKGREVALQGIVDDALADAGGTVQSNTRSQRRNQCRPAAARPQNTSGSCLASLLIARMRGLRTSIGYPPWTNDRIAWLSSAGRSTGT